MRFNEAFKSSYLFLDKLGLCLLLAPHFPAWSDMWTPLLAGSVDDFRFESQNQVELLRASSTQQLAKESNCLTALQQTHITFHELHVRNNEDVAGGRSVP